MDLRTRQNVERNGWKLYAHPAFGRKLESLIDTVDTVEQQEPRTYRSHPQAKLLKRILDLILVEIPRDPNAAEFQLGNTLGPSHRHWRRAKFLGRLRLFFRFSSGQRTIVYAWVNDAATLRKAGAQSDPYAVFTKRLQKGNPPDGWDVLVREAEHTEPRFGATIARTIRKANN
jgi:toxin YhaV